MVMMMCIRNLQRLGRSAALRKAAATPSLTVRFVSRTSVLLDRYSRGSGYQSNSRGGSGGNNSYRRPSRGGWDRPNRSRYDKWDKHEEEFEFKNSKFTEVKKLTAEEMSEEISIESLKKEGLLHEQLYDAVKMQNFESLTPVQQRTIKPILMTSNDVVARAKTGTGKTMAFLIPMFQRLFMTQNEYSDKVKCVVVAPTRDLAEQIQFEVLKLQKANKALRKFSSICLIGGTSLVNSMRRMDRHAPSIVIATPGRLLDVMGNSGDKYFNAVDFKVLDEADTLLDIGFKADLQRISSTLNSLNQKGAEHIRTLLFSATISSNVQELANNIMNGDTCLFIDTVHKDEPEAHEKITQNLIVSESYAHNLVAPVETIEKHLKKRKFKAILFLPTVKSVEFYGNLLKKLFRSLPISLFHGKVSQQRRSRLVKEFKASKHGLFICTDVGARGMDFPEVDHVYQLGVPSGLSNYVHRIGRTARGGREGEATIFLCKQELPFINELERQKNIQIANQEEYTPDSAIEEKCYSGLSQQDYELEEFLKSCLSFYRSVMQEFRLRDDITASVGSAYGNILGGSEKIKLDSNVIARYANIRNRKMINEVFDLGGSQRHRSSDQFDYFEDSNSSKSYQKGSYGSRGHFDNYQRRSNLKYSGNRNNSSNPSIDY
ncbi:ATP-dependent RNA helicase Ecym_4165 [Eremothecium cymbalariae DBVPG|uniref:ATP-dependent RNA helicase n=1 Tax=Eremothecium cymbalariae (strain CBS 270.75 / DBVPG 7215 / KCTC 17166 / NRRL Y-17582) TaxID=931890 RepID=G8JT89_ERECY|nr:hypothetical protein Ecym_4165 [Eremothecium cymbalariae DBVPG\